MKNNIVKEVTVDNVIPVGKPKSGLSIQQLDETLLVLYDRLTRINKYPVKDLTLDTASYTDGVYEDDGSGIFNDFYIGYRNDFTSKRNYYKDIECRFYYMSRSDGSWVRKTCFVLSAFGEPIDFPKKEITTKLKRKQMAIWLASKVYLHYQKVAEHELEDLLNKSEFCEEHDIVRWDLI